MKEIHNFKIVDRWHEKCYGPHHHVLADGFEFVSSHGSSDDISLYRNDSFYYLLAINRRHGYVGLSRFNSKETEEQIYEGEKVMVVPEDGEFFIQNDHEIEDVLGKKGLDLAERTILKRLNEYIE